MYVSMFVRPSMRIYVLFVCACVCVRMQTCLRACICARACAGSNKCVGVLMTDYSPIPNLYAYKSHAKLTYASFYISKSKSKK